MGAGHMPYSEAFRAKMVRKMTGPRGRSANALAEEVGVCQTTLLLFSPPRRGGAWFSFRRMAQRSWGRSRT